MANVSFHACALICWVFKTNLKDGRKRRGQAFSAPGPEKRERVRLKEGRCRSENGSKEGKWEKDRNFPAIWILTRINCGIAGIRPHLAAQLKSSPSKKGKVGLLTVCVCKNDRKRAKDSRMRVFLCFFTYHVPTYPKENGEKSISLTFHLLGQWHSTVKDESSIMCPAARLSECRLLIYNSLTFNSLLLSFSHLFLSSPFLFLFLSCPKVLVSHPLSSGFSCFCHFPCAWNTDRASAVQRVQCASVYQAKGQHCLHSFKLHPATYRAFLLLFFF